MPIKDPSMQLIKRIKTPSGEIIKEIRNPEGQTIYREYGEGALVMSLFDQAGNANQKFETPYLFLTSTVVKPQVIVDYQGRGNVWADKGYLTSTSNYPNYYYHGEGEVWATYSSNNTKTFARANVRTVAYQDKDGVRFDNGSYSAWANSPVVRSSQGITLFLSSGGYSYQGKLYSFYISVGVTGSDPQQTLLLPVKSGSTRYSSTPAPSNCLYDSLKNNYIQAANPALIGYEEVYV
jgi:hypothetical protein